MVWTEGFGCLNVPVEEQTDVNAGPVEFLPLRLSLRRLLLEQLQNCVFAFNYRLGFWHWRLDVAVSPFARKETLHTCLNSCVDELDLHSSSLIVKGADKGILALECLDQIFAGAVVGLLDVDGGRKDGSGFSTAQNGDVEEPTGQECIENWGSNDASSLQKEMSVLRIDGIHERV